MLNPTSNRQFWCRWTLSCAAGEILGIGAAGGMAGVVLATIGEPASGLERLANLLLMMLAGALEGYLVGFFQWRVLRQRLGVPGRSWITATATVAVLGWFVGMLFSTFAPNPAPGAPSFEPTPLQVALLAAGFGLGIGTVFGLGQWLVLRYYAYQAGSWILANALGWGAGDGLDLSGRLVPPGRGYGLATGAGGQPGRADVRAFDWDHHGVVLAAAAARLS